MGAEVSEYGGQLSINLKRTDLATYAQLPRTVHTARSTPGPPILICGCSRWPRGDNLGLIGVLLSTASLFDARLA